MHCRSAGLGRTRIFHPWGLELEGEWSGSNVSVSHVVRPRQGPGFEGLGWVPLGPKRARQGPVWSRIGPYISRTPIRDSRVIRGGSSGPVRPYQVPTGFRRNPVLARIGSRIDRLARNKDQMNPTACPDPSGPLLRPKTVRKNSFYGKRSPAAGRGHRRTPSHRTLGWGPR